MIISGRESAITLIMKAMDRAQRRTLAKQRLDHRDDAVDLEYIGMPMTTAAGTDHQASLPMIEASSSSGA